MGQSNGSSIFKFGTITFIWQRDYRLIIQAIRCMFALLPVIILFAIFKNEMLIWMGLCILVLMQSNVTSPFWRFEYNIFFAFCVSSIGLLLSVFFASSVFLLCLFSFFVAFLIFLAIYFKLNTIYSTWIYILVQFGALSEKSFSDGLQNILYNFYGFLICFLVCAVLMRPNLKKECRYEMLAILEYLQRYLSSFKKDLFLNTEKSRAVLMEQRAYAFARLQSLGMQMKDLQKLNNNRACCRFSLRRGKTRKSRRMYSLYIRRFFRGFDEVSDKTSTRPNDEMKSVILMSILKERLAEIVVGTIINVRAVNAEITEKNEILSILNDLLQQDMTFTLKRKIPSYDKISEFYKQMIIDVNEKISLAEKISQKEMTLIYAKFRINVNLLPEEIKNYTAPDSNSGEA